MFNCDRFELQDTHIRSDSEDGLKPECLLGNIEFEKVDFVYETRPEIKVGIYTININVVSISRCSINPSFSLKPHLNATAYHRNIYVDDNTIVCILLKPSTQCRCGHQ